MNTNLQHELDQKYNNFNDAYADDALDEYAEYEAAFDPMQTDRRARRKRKAKVVHIAKKSTDQQIVELAEDISRLEAGFKITYQPARHEGKWLLSSLQPFYQQGVISDVIAQVKGGKEASVYRCEATEAFAQANDMDTRMIAAKVYRPRQFRNLSNDAMYRQGRNILKSNGKAAKKTDHRMMRAVGKKTAYGVQVSHTSWLMYEFNTLSALHRAGAAVPPAYSSGENAILMGYIGDERRAAPALNEIDLTPEDAMPLFKSVLHNVDLLLGQGWIHGDLSAYNILYWDGEVTLIDFPQVTHCKDNPNAYNILRRDIQRVCEYFSQYEVRANPHQITQSFWEKYAAEDPQMQAADLSRVFEEQ